MEKGENIIYAGRLKFFKIPLLLSWDLQYSNIIDWVCTLRVVLHPEYDNIVRNRLSTRMK